MRSYPNWAAGLVFALTGCVGSVDDGRNTPGGRKPGDPPGSMGGGSMGGGMMGGGGGPAPTDTPGRTPLRRLTRAQYDNTIRDLLGVNESLAGSFGLDEEDGGFQSNAKAPVKELQIERYQQTAEDLAGRVVATPGTLAKSCAPPRASEATCVDDVVRGFGKRAYRRPLTAAEVERYKALFAAGKGASDFNAGLALVVSTMLQSPYFLYRPELGGGGVDKVGLPLSQYEVASRLSYFLQNTMPDDQLFAAADEGKLSAPDDIATQARRLLDSPKARDTMVSFYQQWLGIEDLLTVEKDAKAYPTFNAELLAAMKEEVLEFVDQVTRQGDGKLSTLLGAQFSYVKGPLYQHYGVQGTGGTLKRVDLPAQQRAGVMTLAAVMARHAHADQTSLVGRGYLISDKLLCVVPPPPPDGADNNIPKPDPNVSTRERFTMHRAKPECASCHELMDPLGIAFEIYDGIGRYRTMDGNLKVDASSELSRTDRDGPVTNAVDLLQRLATTSEVRACMATQWFRYAFGRADTTEDAATVAAALGAFTRAEYSIPDLMVALTTTGNFRYRKPLSP